MCGLHSIPHGAMCNYCFLLAKFLYFPIQLQVQMVYLLS